jgi:hypothetical protein
MQGDKEAVGNHQDNRAQVKLLEQLGNQIDA